MTNPAETHELPAFAAIRAEHIEPAIREMLDENRARLEALLDSGRAPWDSLVVPLEEMHHRLARTWSPVGHMNGVVNSDELRAAYNACLPLLTAWNTELGAERAPVSRVRIDPREGRRTADCRPAQAAGERFARFPARGCGAARARRSSASSR